LTPLIIAVAKPQRASFSSGAAVPSVGRIRRFFGGISRPFVLGLSSGVVYFALTLYWLVETMTTFGGLPPALSVFAAFLLVAYLSLFPAVFALIVARATRSLGVRAILLAPAFWVASELGRQYVWDGFPWALLGYSQITWLPIAQLASLVGVYGLSGLIALTASAAAFAVVARSNDRWLAVAGTSFLVGGIALWGNARLSRGDVSAAGQPVRVAVVQGNIAQEEKWDPAKADTIFRIYMRMTRDALAQGATFIIWPESSTPFLFEHDIARGGAIRQLAIEGQATFLIGSDQVEPVKPTASAAKSEPRYYNAAFLVRPDGSTGAVYRKMHLVPFGEYVPAKRLLFFVGTIVEAASDFSAGTEPVLLPVDGHSVSTAICYEVIYASLMRQFVNEGSELLTTITNDAWYGRSSAPYQHWDQAALRAIEGGRFLARAANTGISGFVDPYGRVLQKSQLFEQKLLVQDLRFLQERTLYSRIGDSVAWLSLALTAAVFLATRRVG
jgi:apolipoprotein N-acyltransferase